MEEQVMFTRFIGTLLQSQIQSKIYHWTAQEEGSFSAHLALGDYYDEIGDRVDGLVESFQGRYGIIGGFRPFTPFREYFTALRKYVETNRFNFTQDTYIQNQVDEVVALIETTLYKTKNLR
jgi:DNA-binding ferritin-like protein